MKVSELIEELKNANPDANVVIYNANDDVPQPDVWFDVTSIDDVDDNFVIEVE